jgi:hypothetical protein
VTKSTGELHKFVTEKLARVPGVERTSTVVVPTVIKDIHEWLPEELGAAIDQSDDV